MHPFNDSHRHDHWSDRQAAQIYESALEQEIDSLRAEVTQLKATLRMVREVLAKTSENLTDVR